MTLSQRLQQRQSQSLVMTPQLAQSIKLLQLSHGELMEFVREEIEKNPLLELSSLDSDGLPPEKRNMNGPEAGKTAAASEDLTQNTADHIASQAMPSAEQLDTSFDNVFDSDRPGSRNGERASGDVQPRSPGQGGRASGAGEDFDLIANTGEVIDLAGHLERQIGLSFKNARNREVAIYIAHGLDDDGYFKEPIGEAAGQTGVTPETFSKVLDKFQTLEPCGVGARDLAECLALQLKERKRLDAAMEVLIGNLELLARREFQKLMGLCGVDRDTFSKMIDEIRSLDPRPARSFEPVLSEAVVPDVIVSRTSTGEWHIELNPETLPKVLVDRTYHVELSSALENREGAAFVNECLENANWLTRALDQRAQTILKVTQEIVKRQDRFFAQGREFMKPLTLKAVADAIKMHESTVSRVTSNKYLTCEQGTFELKFFFSSAISATDGDGTVSAEAVKHRIRQMVDAETGENILSDEQIVSQLQEAGIDIARRTVAKYREALNIASSVQRRREKTRAL